MVVVGAAADLDLDLDPDLTVLARGRGHDEVFVIVGGDLTSRIHG